MINLIPRFIAAQFKQQVENGRFHAATLFIDISGFTPLTATLLEHRKEGAEILANALTSIFEPLVTAVYDFDGFIATFAGDAFIAVFPAPPEQAEAAAGRTLATAAFSQAFFTGAGNTRLIHTRYGDFVIGIKIGLAWGEVAWGTPGCDGMYNYYFLGHSHVLMEAKAGLARVALAVGQTSTACAHVTDILHFLQNHALFGTDQTILVYYACYQVLRALRDENASLILAEAYQLLQDRAAQISTEEKRNKYLENVTVHRNILIAYEAKEK